MTVESQSVTRSSTSTGMRRIGLRAEKRSSPKNGMIGSISYASPLRSRQTSTLRTYGDRKLPMIRTRSAMTPHHARRACASQAPAVCAGGAAILAGCGLAGGGGIVRPNAGRTMRQAACWAAAVWMAATAAQAEVTVERFTPQGVAKPVRQATAVFSAPMVPFGDLRDVAPPFTVDCPVPGTGRWVDSRTWAYDFARDLPGGVRCAFAVRAGLASQAGEPVAAARFELSTGGPAIRSSVPLDGSNRIDERQLFVLALDGEASPESIVAQAGFEVAGIAERVGVSLAADAERDAVAAALPHWLQPFVVLGARQTFPAATRVRLVWGAGIVGPGGVATAQDQVLEFETRPAFTVQASCERENARADCTPLTPIGLTFSAPVSWAQAQRIRLLAGDGSERTPTAPEATSEWVTSVWFAPPFPPETAYRVELPVELRDDAGRTLPAAAPLTVKTAPYPPLAKFAARFGLLEAKADPALPVTIRNLDPQVQGQEVRATRQRPAAWRAALQDLYARLGGTVTKVETAEDVLPWLRRLALARRDRSMFADLPPDPAPRAFTLPQPDGPQTMQVVGIPFDGPGLYLVELTSPRLGAALLADGAPMYVPAGALVTNLAVHFKWARENALAWVTTLDQAQPVEGARLTVQDCGGAVLATAVSDAQGIARFTGLPAPDAARTCYDYERFKGFTGFDYRDHYSAPGLTGLDGGLLVIAETTGDLSFVHSSWQRGIEPWRFNLPSERWDAPGLAHTIFDRTLFRAGDTVHMKHVLRAQTLAGFGPLGGETRPVKTVITHLGSNETWELPLSWGDDDLAEQQWPIPAAAKLGTYGVQLVAGNGRALGSGSFRLEQFRVPLMKASVQLPAQALVGASEAPVDVAVQYLAGAGGLRALHLRQRRGARGHRARRPVAAR